MGAVEILPGDAAASPAALTPSQEIIRDANRTVEVRDKLGRTLTLKRPGVLAQFRLIELVGPETAKNDVYMGMALPLFWLVKLNGEDIYPPQTKAELEVLIQRVEEEGIEAIVLGIAEHFEKRGTDADPKDQLKNA